MAERIPIRPAVKAMPSGVRDKGRAAAAGMINMAAISNTPTTLTPLLDVDGAIQLEFRDNAVFKAHNHSNHDDHGDHDDHDDHDGHDVHGAHDPHAWLSPKNAMTLLDVIASRLSDVDPVNSDAYVANAASGRAVIEVLMDDVETTLIQAQHVSQKSGAKSQSTGLLAFLPNHSLTQAWLQQFCADLMRAWVLQIRLGLNSSLDQNFTLS